MVCIFFEVTALTLPYKHAELVRIYYQQQDNSKHCDGKKLIQERLKTESGLVWASENKSTWRRGKMAENRCCANMRRPPPHSPRRRQPEPATTFPEALGPDTRCIKDRFKIESGLVWPVWASQNKVPKCTWRLDKTAEN